MATVQGSKWTPGGLVRARSRDWVVLPPDEPDVVLQPSTSGSKVHGAHANSGTATAPQPLLEGPVTEEAYRYG